MVEQIIDHWIMNEKFLIRILVKDKSLIVDTLECKKELKRDYRSYWWKNEYVMTLSIIKEFSLKVEIDIEEKGEW